jgi:hypothetical protein
MTGDLPGQHSRVERRTRYVGRIPIGIAVVTVLAALAGCGGSDDDAAEPDGTVAVDTPDTGTVLVTEPATDAGSPSDADVPWENYDPAVRTRIAELFAAGDCAGLQGEFNVADADNAAQASRAGEDNARLMTYLDQLLRAAGCF